MEAHSSTAAGPIRRLLVALTAALVVSAAMTAPSDAVESGDSSPRSSVTAQGKKPVRTVDYARGAAVWEARQVRRAFSETNPGFRAFMERRIRHVASRGCEQTGEITIYRWRSDGWAVATEHYGCGGHSVLYRRTSRGWRAPMALLTQDGYHCKTLRTWKVPPALLHRTQPRHQPYRCYTGDGRYIQYR